MRFFTDLRRGLLAAASLATLQVALPAHAQQYPAYPQTAQPYAQAAGQNPYAALPQPTPQPYVATQPVTTVATQPVASTAPYQQYSAARQQVVGVAQQGAHIEEIRRIENGGLLRHDGSPGIWKPRSIGGGM